MLKEFNDEFKKLWIEEYGSLNEHNYAYYYALRILNNLLHRSIISFNDNNKLDNESLNNLIHDTAHSFDVLLNVTRNFEKKLKETKEVDSNYYVYLEYFKNHINIIKDNIDKFYLLQKK